MRTPIPPPPDEVVEDSEPEREQRRQEERAKRKTKRKDLPSTNEQKVIAISSDSDATNMQRASPAKRERRHESIHQTVIEISDDEPAYDWDNLDIVPSAPSVLNGPAAENQPSQNDASGDSTRMPSVREILGLPRQLPSAGSSRDSFDLPPATRTEILLPGSTSKESSPPKRSGSRMLDIARFAYAGSHRTISSRASSIVPSRATPTIEAPKPPTASRAVSGTLSNFSDSDLGKLRRCICCELAWTTRKTAPQKLKHIQSCAKKLQILPDTLQHLFRAELQRVKQLPPEEKGKKGKLPDVPEPTEPGTMLEVALDGGGKKKSGPRRPVVESVKELHETRQVILDRAKQLLGAPSKASALAHGEEDTFAPVPPATQPFGESRLAQRYNPNTVLDQTQAPMHVPDFAAAGPSRHSHEGAEEPELNLSPPRTQPFGESALAKKFGKTRARDIDLDEDVLDRATTHHRPNRSPSRSPLRTQPFGDSTLVRKYGKTHGKQPTNLLDTEDLHSPPHNPPSTRRHIFNQVSNSSPARRTAILSDDSDVEISDGPPPSFTLNPNPTTPPSLLKPHSSNELGPWFPSVTNSPLVSPVPSRSNSPGDDAQAGPGGFAWGDMGEWEPDHAMNEYHYDNYGYDDAVIHYSPTNEILLMEPSKNLSDDSPVRRERRRSASEVASASEDKAKKPKSKSKKSKKPKRDEKEAFTDEELHAKLRERIEQNTPLYHRILRYEPIHFDVFLALASDLGAPSRGLKLRIREFLDKQAIHFYGLDATKDRTKKRRG